MSSLTETTETNQLSNIQELIQEYIEQGRNDQSIIIQQEEIDSDINDLTKLSTEPEEQGAIKGIQQPSVDPITLDDIPTLVSPSNGATITDTTPYMDWTSSGTYMNFNIELDNNADFSSPVIDQLTGYDTFYTVSSALAGGTYYWRVREQDFFTKIWDSFCSAWSFVVDTTPTEAPILVSPTNGFYTNDDTPYLDWNSVARATSYQVQVSSNSLFLFPQVNTNTPNTYFTSSHLNDGYYFYRVRGFNSYGNGPWSAVWEFIVDTVLPGSVTLVSPSNGAVTSDYTPYFDWNIATGAWRYRLEVDNTPDFSSPGIIVTTSGTSYTSGLNLLNGYYYWRVRASDQAGNDGPWSATWQLRINKEVPPAPILITPSNGALITDNTPFMDWNPATLGVLYQIQIDNNGDFSSPTRDYTTALTYYTPSTLGDGTYYWRVRARDSIGNWGPWCSAWHFTIDTVPPGPPILITPTINQYINDNTPFMDWNSVTGGYQYQIQIDTTPMFTAPVRDYTSTATAYTPTVLADGTYYWRVRAIDLAGNIGAWSSIWYFTIDTLPPSTPALITPINDVSINDNTPYLDWTTATGGYNYQLQVDNNGDFSSPIVDQTFSVTAYTPTVLGDGTYYWRVRAIDQAGNVGAWSSIWHFTVDTLPPSTPTLITPTNGVSTNDSTPYLDWTTATGGYNYQLQVDNDPDFSSLIVDQTSTATFYTSVTLADGTYYWRVRAIDQAGNVGTWSGIWHFTVDTIGPDQVLLYHPMNGNVISDSTPLLEWYASTDAIEYQILVDINDAFSSPFVVAFTNDVMFNIDTMLTDGSYYWKVRAKDSVDNWSDWSETWSFTVDATGPDQPSLSSPANGTLSNDNLPQLIASIVSTAVTYQFQIALTDSFDTLIIDIVVPANYYDAVSALIDGTYYWRARAADSLSNWSDWSETWSFTIDTTSPNQPSLIIPANETITNDNEPLLEVIIIPTAESYQFQIALTDSFDTLIVDIVVFDNFYDLDSALIDGTYYWRVRAADGLDNWSGWSDVCIFTIDTTNPDITQPEDASFDFGTIGNTINWTLSDLHPNTYIIYLNGAELHSDVWSSGDNVSVSLDGLGIGTYNYTIVVSDLAGNSFSDCVIVAIEVVIQEFNPITGLLIIGLCVVIPLLTIKQKFKRKNDD
ncbi:MAG: hypothetical protein KGD64_05425 [Candidatus Heimdallarchaeota archaeon]|nr:hypothetical protein [Candidatus Heimdallarchaeota archaeon]